MICKNCEEEFNGNFCNNCGQKSETKKINYSYLIDEISNNILQVNRGIFFTIKELSIRPGHSIREFLNGKRKQHFKPIAFVLLTSALYVLVTFLLNEKTFLGSVFSGMVRALTETGSEKSMTANILSWLSNNFNYSSLFLLPFFSLASYISFRKEEYNFFEHLVLNCYLTGQQTLIYLISTIIISLLKVESYYFPAFTLLITILFTFWTFNQFFYNRKIFSKTLLTFTSYVLYFLVIMLVILTFGIIDGIFKR
jgi:hypothetical protein|tara:strand:- start:88 stop:846 length:759 start_codon:yes stop_codon:yes gene_type:complete